MRSPIKVLHVSSALSWRGGEQQIANLIQGLQESHPAEVESIVFCAQNGAFHQYCLKNDIPVETYHKRSGFSFRTAKQLRQVCKKYSIDIVHTHDSHAHTYAFLASFLFGNKCPIVVHRKVSFRNKGFFSRLKYNHGQIASYICISADVKKSLSQCLHHSNLHKIHLIYDSIDTETIDKTKRKDLRKELDLADNSIIIGTLSALTYEKDYQTFLQVAQTLINQSDKYHFIIIGKGGLEQELKQLVQDLNIAKNIHFLGFKNDAVAYLKDFDVFLMTSKQEGLGTAVLEAFVCGVPVVSTNAGGLKESVIHEETGLIYDVGDVRGLVEGVQQVLSNQNLKSNLLMNAKQKVESEFAINIMGKKTVTQYRSIVI